MSRLCALLGADFWTLAYNRRLGDRGMLQLEYVTVDSRARSAGLTQNNVDINDDLAQVNYRLQFWTVQDTRREDRKAVAKEADRREEPLRVGLFFLSPKQTPC